MTFSLRKPRLPDTEQHEKLRADVLDKLNSWCKFVIAIDGVDGVGKSSLARYLAWQTGIALVESDLFMESLKPLKHRLDHLNAAINHRRMNERPIIIEGVQVLQTLGNLEIDPEYLVIVEQHENEGSYTLANQFNDYREQYKIRLSKVDFLFKW